MPHDRSALIDQLRALLTQQRYDSVVIHNYCRSAEHFLEYLARRNIAVDAATPDHVSGYLQLRRPEIPPASRSPTSAAMGIHSPSGNPCAAAARTETVATRATASQSG